MNETKLAQAVEQLALVMESWSDEKLGQDWTWGYHDEGLRFALLGTYHELRDLAVSLTAGRNSAGVPITASQHILAQYHAAFRDLQAVLLGITDQEMDRPPAEGEWPLRDVLGHIIRADRRFFALVFYAVQAQNSGQETSSLTDEQMEALLGLQGPFEEIMEAGALAEIWAYYADLHGRVLVDMGDSSDQDLTAPSRFWEDEPMLVGFRLHRFDAHVRQHTVQAEKTLMAIGHTPNEAKRLLRLVYNALAEAEGAIIGALDFGLDQRQAVAAVIEARAKEMAAIA